MVNRVSKLPSIFKFDLIFLSGVVEHNWRGMQFADSACNFACGLRVEKFKIDRWHYPLIENNFLWNADYP